MAFTLRKHLIHEFDWEQGWFNEVFADFDENGPVAIVKAVEELGEEKCKTTLIALTFSLLKDLNPMFDYALTDRWDQVVLAARRAGVSVPEPSDWRPGVEPGEMEPEPVATS